MSIANPVPVSPPDAIAAIAPASPRPSSVSADYQIPALKMVNFLFLDKEEIAILRRIQVLTNNGEHLCVLSNDTIEDELKIPTSTSQRALQTLKDLGMIYTKIKDTEMGKNSRVIFFDRHRTAELSGSYDFMGLPASVLEKNPVFTAHAAAESQALARAESAAVHNTAPVSVVSSSGSSVDSSNAVSSADNNSTASFADISTASSVGSSTDSAADNGSVVSTADSSMASLEVAAADLVIVPAALNVSESLIITPAAELMAQLGSSISDADIGIAAPLDAAEQTVPNSSSSVAEPIGATNTPPVAAGAHKASDATATPQVSTAAPVAVPVPEDTVSLSAVGEPTAEQEKSVSAAETASLPASLENEVPASLDAAQPESVTEPVAAPIGATNTDPVTDGAHKANDATATPQVSTDAPVATPVPEDTVSLSVVGVPTAEQEKSVSAAETVPVAEPVAASATPKVAASKAEENYRKALASLANSSDPVLAAYLKLRSSPNGANISFSEFANRRRRLQVNAQSVSDEELMLYGINRSDYVSTSVTFKSALVRPQQVSAAAADAVQQVTPQVDDSDCQDVTVESDGTVVVNADAPYVEMPQQLLLALQQETGLAAGDYGDECDSGDNSTVAPNESTLLRPSVDTVAPPEDSALPLLPLLACLESEDNHDVTLESDGTVVAKADAPYVEQSQLLLLAFHPEPCEGAGDNTAADNSHVTHSKSVQRLPSADTMVPPESPALPLLPLLPYHKPEGTQALALTSGLTVVANAEAPYKKMPTRLLMQALQPVPLLASGADSMLVHSKSAQFNPAAHSVVPPKAAAQPLLPLLVCLESEDNQGVMVESDGTVVANADAPYMEMPQQEVLPPQDAISSQAVSEVATASAAKSTSLINRPVSETLSVGLHQFLEHAKQQQAQKKANGALPVRERGSYLPLREVYYLPATDPRMVAYNRAALRTYTAPNSQQLPIHCDLYQFDFTEALKRLKLGPVMFCGESEPCHSFDFTSAAEYLSVANVSTQRYHYSESSLNGLFEQFFRFSVLSEICYYSEDMFALPDDKAPRLDEKQLKEFFATKQQGMLLQLLGVTHGFTSGPYTDAERCKVTWCSKSLWNSISRNMHLYRSKSPLPFLRACVRRQLLHGLKDEDSYKAMLQVFKSEFRHFIQEQLWVKHYSFPATTDANSMQHFYPAAFRRLMSVDGQNMVFRLTYPMLLWRKIGCVREASGLTRCENFINNDNAAMLLMESAYNPQVQEQWANFVAAFGKHYPFLTKLGGCEHV